MNGSQKVVEVVPEEDLTSTLTGRVSFRLQQSHFVDATFNLTVSSALCFVLFFVVVVLTVVLLEVGRERRQKELDED